jgi:hypothetical protein
MGGPREWLTLQLAKGVWGCDESREVNSDRATAKPLGSNKVLGLVSDGVVTLEVCYVGVIRGMMSLCDAQNKVMRSARSSAILPRARDRDDNYGIVVSASGQLAMQAYCFAWLPAPS